MEWFPSSPSSDLANFPILTQSLKFLDVFHTEVENGEREMPTIVHFEIPSDDTEGIVWVEVRQMAFFPWF
jgi:hypothetical protein